LEFFKGKYGENYRRLAGFMRKLARSFMDGRELREG